LMAESHQRQELARVFEALKLSCFAHLTEADQTQVIADILKARGHCLDVQRGKLAGSEPDHGLNVLAEHKLRLAEGEMHHLRDQLEILKHANQN
ncbi:MAG: hypothetical protein AAFY56_17840, partial [Pseudomonadota bacterium]